MTNPSAFRSTLVFVLCAPIAGVVCAAQTDSIEKDYRETASRIIGAAMTDHEGWEKLTHLTTNIGNRLSGAEGLERAIDWASERMRAEGLEVKTEPVKIPHWVRGNEYVELVAPRKRRLPMLGLGGSIATPRAGITAPVVVVRSFDELESLGRASIEGKIVVYAVEWEGYGRTVRYRSGGASRAAALGAVAVLVRSATGRSLATPHTGGMRYEQNVAKIPAAAITVEDAEWMRRAADRGVAMSVKLYMEAEMLEDADSYNVIAEIPGGQNPEQVVVMGGHYDSWDVGQGAHDDGAACIAAWHALTLIHRMGLVPRRTLRVVLWTNEENGLAGGRAYRDNQGLAVGDHVAAIEMDGGAERPVGFGLGEPSDTSRQSEYDRAIARLESIASFFDGIEAGSIRRGGGGADIGPLMREGVPGMALQTVGEHYFDWHHTQADTLDKVEPNDFRRAMAMLGVMGFVLADMPERFDEIYGRE